MAELALPEPELHAAEAVGVGRHAFPARDLCRDRFRDGHLTGRTPSVLPLCRRPVARERRRGPIAGRGYPPSVPFYQRLGDVPRKRHVQFRDNGRLLTEEVFGIEGFAGNESILYHLQSPCRISELGEFEPLEREEWVPEAHAHRHFKTMELEP